MKGKRRAAWLLAAALVITSVSPVGAAFADGETPSGVSGAEVCGSVRTQPSAEVVSVMVELESPSVFDSGLELGGPEADALTAALLAEQERVLEEIRKITGLEHLEAEYRYTALVNGFSIFVQECFLGEIEQTDGVLRAYQTEFYGIPEVYASQDLTEEQAVSAAEMIGTETAWAMGCDGSGMVVAVIDTGLDLEHPAFADDLNPDELGLTRSEVAASLEYLNAAQRYDGLTVEEIYRNNKVPFAFNYADNVPDVGHDKDTEGDHGTHVAGIVAANDIEGAEMAGIAPEAQLVIMKVFGQAEEEGVFESVLLAALEDAVRLGCDVINMSFGAAHGFTEEEQPLLEKAVERAVDKGVILCAAVGNDFQSAYGNLSETNLPQRGQIDVGTVNAPASMSGVFAVGSFEASGCYAQAFLVEDGGGNTLSVQYTDAEAVYRLDPFASLGDGGDTVYEYVAVPGLGSPEDIAGVDLSGAVALIARGEITFAEKAENAFRAGAAGVIIYNNTDEEITMDLSALTGLYTNPCVFIGREDGVRLVELAGEDGRGELTISRTPVLVKGEGGGEPSDYSGWGVLADLTLNPDLCGVGGLVYSTLDKEEYGTMSGTSMASPQVAGAMALVLEYLREQRGLNGPQAARLAGTLLMNTASPALRADGTAYSPRKQGAGLINVAEAISAQGYITVSGSVLPKAELGDDPLRLGRYRVTFTLHNESETVQRYVPETVVLTEAEEGGCILLRSRPADAEVTYATDTEARSFLYDLDGNGRVEPRDAEQFRLLLAEGDADFEPEWFDLDENGRVDENDAACLETGVTAAVRDKKFARIVFEVPAGDCLDVTVDIRLSASERAQLNAAFEYGIYVDGYVTLSGLASDTTDLSFPLLAFLGDWSRAPLFETFSLPELASAAGSAADGNNPYPMRVVTGVNACLGVNPEITEDEYIPARSNALNVGGGEGGAVFDLYLDLLRDAESITVEMVNSRGEVLHTSHANSVRKSMYVNAYGGMPPIIWSEISGDFEQFVPGEHGIGDGGTFTIRVSGRKAARGGYQTESFSIPVYVDGTAPRVNSVQVSRREDLNAGCSLTVTAHDNFYVACVMLMAADGATVVERYEVDQQVRSALVRLTIDVTEYLPLIGGEFSIGVVDYADNLTVYDVSVLQDGDGTFLPEDSLLGYGTYFERQGWYKQAEGDAQEVLEPAFLDESRDVCAAEQVGGYLFTVERYRANILNVIDTGTYRTVYRIPLDLLRNYDRVIDLAYVDQERMLYILAWADGEYVLLRADLHRESVERVMSIDGAQIEGLEGVYTLSDWENGALAIVAGVRTEQGDTVRAQLYTLGVDAAAAFVCDLGLELNTATMSAVYEKNSGTLYFSCYDRSYPEGSGLPMEVSGLYRLDAGSRSPELVLDCGRAVLNALIWTGETETTFDPTDPLTEIVLSSEEIHLLRGQSAVLTVTDSKPWYARRDGWQMGCTSDNTSAAWAYHNGMVTAAGEGTAEITVTLSRFDLPAISAVCTVVVEPTPLMRTLTESGVWMTYSTGSWTGELTVPGMDGEIVLAAYAPGAGGDGADVVYAINGGGVNGEGETTVYTLYTVAADSWVTLEERPLTPGGRIEAGVIPANGFADLAYDPYTGYLMAVSGDRCYVINPLTAVIYDSVSLSESCGSAVLLGAAFASDGTGWFLDSEGTLHETLGFLSGFAVNHSVSVFSALSGSEHSASLEWDQLRDVLWIAWGQTVYRVENDRARYAGSLGELPLCWFMKYYG